MIYLLNLLVLSYVDALRFTCWISDPTLWWLRTWPKCSPKKQLPIVDIELQICSTQENIRTLSLTSKNFIRIKSLTSQYKTQIKIVIVWKGLQVLDSHAPNKIGLIYSNRPNLIISATFLVTIFLLCTFTSLKSTLLLYSGTNRVVPSWNHWNPLL